MEWVQFRTLTFRFRHKFVKLSAAKLSPFLAARFAASKSRAGSIITRAATAAEVNTCSIRSFFSPTNSPKKSQPSNMSIEGSPPVVVPAKEKQNGTVIFFHGLGDQGDGWASMFRDEIRIKTTKFICPNAADRPVTLNFGMSMPAWFDLKGLSQDAEEDEQGIAAATEYVHNLVEQEIAAGVPAEKIILGGFSMGGALAIYAGLTCKHKLAGIVGLSSFLLQRTKLPGSHTANLQTKILLGHGSNDFLVPLTFGQMTQAAIKEFNPNVELKVYPGMQHSSCPQEMSDVKKFIEKVLK